MSRKIHLIPLVGLFAATAAGPGVAMAHHSFAMFDQKTKLTLQGTVHDFQWNNPHAYVIVDTIDAKGMVVRYTFECSSPNLLSHAGWRPDTIKVGEKVTINYYPLKDGMPGGMLMTVKFPTGRIIKAW